MDLPLLLPGDSVRVRAGDDTDWRAQATVDSQVGPRSYIVCDDGRTLRRNRRHLQLVPEPATPVQVPLSPREPLSPRVTRSGKRF